MAAPSGVYVTLGTVTENSATVSGVISSYENLSTDPAQYIEVAVLSSRNYQTPSVTSRLEGSTNLSYSATLTESDTLKITPNTRYYYAVQASNGSETTTSSIGEFVSSPTPAVIRWVDEQVSNCAYPGWGIKAKIAFTQSLGNGAKSLRVYYRYSLNGGDTWENNWTLIAQNTEQGFFYIDNLPFGQSVLVQTYTQGARASEYNDTVFITQQAPEVTTEVVWGYDALAKQSNGYFLKVTGEYLPYELGDGYIYAAQSPYSSNNRRYIMESGGGSQLSTNYNTVALYLRTSSTRKFTESTGGKQPLTPNASTYNISNISALDRSSGSSQYTIVSPRTQADGRQLPRPILGVIRSNTGTKIITDIAEVKPGEQLDSSNMDVRYDRFIVK